MDPSGWAAIGLIGVVALVADICIAGYFAGWYGPRKARTLIITDPEYVETKQKLDILTHDMRAVEDRISRVSGTIESKMKAQLDAFSGRVEDKLGTIQVPDTEVLAARVTAKMENFTVPQKEIDRITSSVKATLRRNLETPDLLEGLSALMDDKLKGLGAGEIEDIEEYVNAESFQDLKQEVYEWLIKKGLPENVSYHACERGWPIVKNILKVKGWDITEVYGAA